jgi:hypothetical protein
MIEKQILKSFINDKELFTKYYKFLNLKFLRDNYSNIYKLFQTLNSCYETLEKVTIEELELKYHSNYLLKDSERTDLTNLLQDINNAPEVERDLIIGLLEEHRRRSLAGDVAKMALDVEDGKSSVTELLDLFSKFEHQEIEIDQAVPVVMSLKDLYTTQVATPGLRWRLKFLNQSLGSLRKGDFGFIFARPESFTRDTEVLTPQGWLTVDKVTLDTPILQVTENLSSQFVYPLEVHTHEQNEIVHVHDTRGRVNLQVTKGHMMVTSKQGKLSKDRADTVKYVQGVKHHVTSFYTGSDKKLTPLERLNIAFQADGHTRVYKDYGYTISVKKERKLIRLRNILKETGLEYTEYKDGNRENKGFYIKSPNYKLSKNFDWVDLLNMGQDYGKEFIEELSYWDATRRTDTRFKFDTTNKQVADVVQAISAMVGYNCLLSKFEDNRKETYSDIYSLSIRTKYEPVDGQSIKKDVIPYTDTTYCFKVYSGMLLVRRNGAVAVCGNTGKTTFLASELSHMGQQTDGDILWFCNEEQGNKVGIRTFQAALGLQLDILWSDMDRHQSLYNSKLQDRIKIFHTEDSSNANHIEQIIKEHNPALIVFDQLDKVKGFKAERKDLELAASYQWARELAKRYAPVIGVSQASGEAEGKLWLTMDMIDGSKTGKAAEADWIIGIGKDSDNTSRSRYLSICKNKLIGDKDILPDLRHGSMQVLIRPEVARYEDLS